MKVIKFWCGDTFYAFAAETEELAKAKFEEEIGEDITETEEIPETEWDNKNIACWEDNDTSKEPFFMSIHEIICGIEPQMVFTNDVSL